MFRPTILLVLTLLTAPALAIDLVNQGTLTFVDEDGFNDMDLELEVNGDTDNDTSDLTGSTMQVRMDIDPSTGQSPEFTILSGDLQGTAVDFVVNTRIFIFIPITITATSSPFAGDVFTTTTPGVMDPATGQGDASQHEFIINQGSVDATAAGNDINIDFAADPFGSATSGIGTVIIVPAGTTPTRALFDVTAILPLNITKVIPTDFGFTANLTGTGLVKATGQVSAPLPYPDWAIAQGIPGAPPEIDSNTNGVQNGIIWALGLGLDDNPLPHLLTPDPATPKGFLLPLPLGGSSGELTIEASPDLSPGSWLPVTPGDLSTGTNPLLPGTTGNVTIAPGTALQRYLRLSTNP